MHYLKKLGGLVAIVLAIPAFADYIYRAQSAVQLPAPPPPAPVIDWVSLPPSEAKVGAPFRITIKSVGETTPALAILNGSTGSGASGGLEAEFFIPGPRNPVWQAMFRSIVPTSPGTYAYSIVAKGEDGVQSDALGFSVDVVEEAFISTYGHDMERTEPAYEDTVFLGRPINLIYATWSAESITIDGPGISNQPLTVGENGELMTATITAMTVGLMDYVLTATGADGTQDTRSLAPHNGITVREGPAYYRLGGTVVTLGDSYSGIMLVDYYNGVSQVEIVGPVGSGADTPIILSASSEELPFSIQPTAPGDYTYTVTGLDGAGNPIGSNTLFPYGLVAQ